MQVVNSPYMLAQKKVNPVPSKPNIVIGLVVDQMRYDYLYRFSKQYGNDGFKRLLKEGNSCENTYIDYIPTVTACGHTAIYTGSVPAIHGIAGNDWYNYTNHKTMYCTQDATENTIGAPGKSGKMSPRNLLTSTITDELRLATNGKSTVIGISLKDRGSILPAGHMANAAYWMDDSLGYWVSSSYYMQQLPNWVSTYNASNKSRKYLNQNWNLSKPIDSYTQSTSDNNLYEGKFKMDSLPVFPHLTSKLNKTADIKKTPYGNSICLDFAKEAITNYNLGRNNTTDFLAISLSSTDYIGHQFGTNAIEIEDMYIKLDADIADFLKFLDAKIGKGNYTIFLTADHGAAHNPTFLQDQKVPAGFFEEANTQKRINELSMAKFGKQAILDMGSNGIWLNDSLDRQSIKAFVTNELKKDNAIQYVIDLENINNEVLPATLKELAINGHNQQRSGQLLYILKPAYISKYGTSISGTTHGTWNPYDTHIPLVWMGNGIATGKVLQKTHVTDIAATLATLLQIQAPNGCIGECIIDLLK